MSVQLLSAQSTMQNNISTYPGKRALDVILSCCGLILISPLLLIAAILVKASSEGPIIYCQQRIGRYFKPFWIYKLRTMRLNSDAGGNTCTVKGDPRITPAGRFLRKTKLDELPQLFNVLAGDMSLVGPRPEVERYVQLFKDDYAEVLRVRPGITDYAAVEFRDEETVLAGYEDHEKAYREEILPAKIRLYKKYLEDISLFTDLKILISTVGRVLGVS